MNRNRLFPFATALAIGSLALIGTAACSAETPSQARERNVEALADYVDLERTAMLALIADSSGLYSDGQVEGAFASSDPDSGAFPEGRSAVITYTYTYAGAIDYSAAQVRLEGQGTNLDSACRTQVFPGVRSAGVTGPIRVIFTYDAEQIAPSSDGPSWTADPNQPAWGDVPAIWSHACVDAAEN